MITNEESKTIIKLQEDGNWKSYNTNMLIPSNKTSSFKVKLIRTSHMHVIVGVSTKKDMGATNPQNSS